MQLSPARRTSPTVHVGGGGGGVGGGAGVAGGGEEGPEPLSPPQAPARIPAPIAKTRTRNEGSCHGRDLACHGLVTSPPVLLLVRNTRRRTPRPIQGLAADALNDPTPVALAPRYEHQVGADEADGCTARDKPKSPAAVRIDGELLRGPRIGTAIARAQNESDGTCSHGRRSWSWWGRWSWRGCRCGWR